MVDITENYVTECLLKVQTFFESICGKMFSWKENGIWMDGYQKKRERKYYLLMKCSVSTQKNLSKRYACCRCSLPSLLLAG